MTDYRKGLQAYLEQEIQMIRALDLDAVNRVMNVLEQARRSGKRIFVCGNGGSAATASHFCCDFNKGINESLQEKSLGEYEQGLYDLACLSDNVPTMMAIANDIGYEEIFRYSLRGRMRSGDVLIGISGSGNSQNVVNALKYAKDVGGTTIAFVGYSGGDLKKIADHCIHIDIHNMQIVEDVHMILDHLMMYVLSGQS